MSCILSILRTRNNRVSKDISYTNILWGMLSIVPSVYLTIPPPHIPIITKPSHHTTLPPPHSTSPALVSGNTVYFWLGAEDGRLRLVRAKNIYH